MRTPPFLMLCFVCCVCSQAVFAQSDGGALLLKNDRLLLGQVTIRGDFYQVKIADQSQVSLPRAQVAFVGQGTADVYRFKLNAIGQLSPGDHFKLTRWCLLNGLLLEAVNHYQHVAEKAKDHPRVKQLSIELRNKLLEQPDFRAYLGLAPLENPSKNEKKESSIANNLSTDRTPGNASVVSASVASDKTLLHPEIAARFSQRVQPILMNRCSQAACHGVRSQSQLKLNEPYAREFSRISSQNLKSALAQVSLDSKAVSPLLKYATTAHGIQRLPAISVTETQLLNELGNWIRLVQNPVVNAVATQSGFADRQDQAVVPSKASQFVPFHPATTLIPVQRGASGLRQVPRDESRFPAGDEPTLEEIDALDRELSRILGESVPSSSEPTSSKRVDPFDPEEFNRQSANSR